MLRRLPGEPLAERFTGGEHVFLRQSSGLSRVTARHGLQERGVLAHAALLPLGEELEEVARHDPDGLAQVGEEPG